MSTETSLVLSANETGITPSASIGPAMSENMIHSFVDMMSQFLSALGETFPTCIRVQGYRIGWETQITDAGNNEAAVLTLGRDAITTYHASMEPFYARCGSRDTSLLSEDIDLLHNMGLKAKWDAGMHPATEDAIWAYINKLNEFANLYAMYSSIPTGMMGSIETMAKGLAGQITGGQMSFSDLNLGELSQQVMAAINPADMQQFVQVVQSGRGLGNVNVMMSMVSNLMQSQQM
jgi:hypothetical protein